MKKWQKEQALAQQGERDLRSLIHEDSLYNNHEKKKGKPHSQRDKHRHATTLRKVVVEKDE